MSGLDPSPLPPGLGAIRDPVPKQCSCSPPLRLVSCSELSSIVGRVRDLVRRFWSLRTSRPRAPPSPACLAGSRRSVFALRYIVARTGFQPLPLPFLPWGLAPVPGTPCPLVHVSFHGSPRYPSPNHASRGRLLRRMLPSEEGSLQWPRERYESGTVGVDKQRPRGVTSRPGLVTTRSIPCDPIGHERAAD